MVYWVRRSGKKTNKRNNNFTFKYTKPWKQLSLESKITNQ